ncbi:transposase [Pseudarthrobacter siccitolerans]
MRAGNYGGTLGDPHRWPGPSQIYRASGLSRSQYESAGKRRDGSISREGSVALRRALIDLGVGCGSMLRRAGPTRPASKRGANMVG